MAPKQATIYLNNSSYTSKSAKSAPLSAVTPKKPSRSEAGKSDQTNFSKHTRKRRQSFSTLVFWGRGSSSGVRNKSPARLTKELPLFFPHMPYMVGGLDSLDWSSPPKNRWFRTRSSAPIEATTKQITNDGGALSRGLMLCDKLIARTDILYQTASQVVGAQPPSPPLFLYPSDGKQNKIYSGSTRHLIGNGIGYLYTKDSTYL